MAAKAGRADMNSPSLDAERLELLGSLGSWHYDPLTGSVALSGGAAALFGLDKALTCTLDELLSMFVKPGREALAAVLYGTAEAAEEPLDADPSTVLLLTRDSNSQAGIIADVSEIVDLRRQLDFARKRQEHFETMSHEWLWETDADLRFTYMSPSVEKIVGVPVEFHIGKTRRELVGDKNESLEMEMHLAWLDRHEPFHDFRYWRAGPDGKEQYISVTGEPVLDADGSFVGYRGTARDLTGQQQIREALLQVNRQLNAANKAKSDAMGSLKEANSLLEERNRQMARAQEDIRHAALHDSLTGLGNRRFMDEELVKALERSLREGIELGVVHVDLDRFKQINDTLGHAAGDAVLVHVAEVLRTKSGVGDVIARVGGDEFVVVTLGKSGSQLLAMGDRIISTLARPFEFEGRQCWYGASAGIAISDGTDLEAQQLLAKADLALYRAKRRGRARVEIFSDEMQREMRESQELADGIQSGLDRQEFVPWYQPQISAADFSICGVEALARWLPPDGSVRTPAEFLPATEELNKVQAIDRMILEAALRDLARWDEAGVEVPRLSVNVSARRLVEPDLAASLAALRPPRGRLAFELLESVFLDDVERTMAWNIDLLKEMGVEIELDDFGSGHASIISLVRLGPDAIKIDRRMAAGIIEDPSRRSLAAAIVGIGKSLGVKVVAEGVESLEQALILAELGCDRLQGFYFARPMPASDVPGFIAKWRDPRVGAIAVAG